MRSDSWLPKLAAIVPADRLLSQPEDTIPYSFDGTAALFQQPVAVVFPARVEEIQAIMRLAQAERFPVVTRGSGTGLSGGSLPVPDSLVLCTTKMNRILAVDPLNLTLRTEPGVTTQAIADAAAAAGLFYPPDPGSMKISTIGGNVAEDSGGLRGLKYGVTRDYILALQVVLADGSVLRTGSPCVKDAAGFSLRDLFVGSEGLLGIVTEILLKLVPKPAARKTALAVFDRMTDAAETVSAIIAAKIVPCTLEFLDQTTTRSVEDYAHVGLPTDAEAVLLMEADGHPVPVTEEIAAMADLARQHGARSVQVAADEAEALRLASARRTAFAALARIAPTTILEDATVPRSELASMVGAIQDIATKYQLKVGIFGHMGDGNLHPTFLTDERNRAEMERVEQAMVEIFAETVRRGGTITGEHGVGLAKKPFLEQAIGSVNIELMRKLKQLFDPNSILNPGKMFEPKAGI